jgi:hypothetical protein
VLSEKFRLNETKKPYPPSPFQVKWSIPKYTRGKFGDIGVVSPACADDIVLLGPSTEIQVMIDVVQYNTRRDLVKLNPGKTEVIRMAKKNNNVSSEYTLEGP